MQESPDPRLQPTDRNQGLTGTEAPLRQAQFGANAIADKPPPAWKLLAAKFWAPVPGMLEAVAGMMGISTYT